MVVDVTGLNFNHKLFMPHEQCLIMPLGAFHPNVSDNVRLMLFRQKNI
jgi:hypothetical protein